MSKMILIDSAHAEETRMVVVKDGTIEEFDYQNIYKKSIKGNIYLAKVIRVEPSLQAAFVDYGSEKHGFLPFSEIHPSYYQLPAADKEALLSSMIDSADERKSVLEQSTTIEQFDIDEDEVEEEIKPQPKQEEITEDFDEESDSIEEPHQEEMLAEAEQSSSIKESEESSSEGFRPDFYKNYKIQEVIKKDQVILIQVVKEERGNKGAAMSSYISLAGRYCVLMPNSFKSGGVSRKIYDNEERNRLKNVAEEINQKIGTSASVIIRTAGAYKTKTEIKRDFNYLTRLWNNVREHTLASKAPAFIHEEGDVIKKSIRDLYSSDIEQIIVFGDEGYANARKFMEMILPRHVDKIKRYKAKIPLFSKYNIENQLSALYDPVVPLKSGGYIVINHTEALVAIDVNSGRSTSERNVENTAYRTNTEAAYEIARQMKLRDISGLIVIDFIDMEHSRNRRTIERIFRDALYNDRAKIQIGRISLFGLLEMTRQRLRQSFFESSTNICSNCDGKGRIRPIEATAVSILRAIDSEIATGEYSQLKISGGDKLMFYLFNNKRDEISQLEKVSKAKFVFYVDNEAGADGFFLEKVKKEQKSKESTKTALSAIDFEPYIDDKSEKSQDNQNRRWKKSKSKPEERSNEEPSETADTIEQPEVIKEVRQKPAKEFREPRRDQRGGQRGDQRSERVDQRNERVDQRSERGDQRNERGDQRGERGDQRNERGDQRGERGDQRGERGDQRGDPRRRGKKYYHKNRDEKNLEFQYHETDEEAKFEEDMEKKKTKSILPERNLEENSRLRV